MEVKINIKRTVGELIELHQKNFLHVNSEYQRGLRWTDKQKIMFIDSIFRGYSIPAFYFHRRKESVGEDITINYDIVDGQQRIDALYSFCEGEFATFNPTCNSDFYFPSFFNDEPCEWGGKKYSELSTDLMKTFRNHPVVVYEIDTDNKNKIRDLFIRLQGGTPLTPQDKRDIWPGNFTEFVLNVGGKARVKKWVGHPLFTKVSRTSDESRRRHLVAQAFMLYWSIKKDMKFCDIKSRNLDYFYHSQVGFDRNSRDVQRFMKICDKLYEHIEYPPKLVGHHLLHLILLTDALMNEYVPESWESKLSTSLHKFAERCAAARDAEKNRIESQWLEYHEEYGRWSQTQSDIAYNIRRRYVFFSEIMLDLIDPKKIDEKCQFSEFEKMIVFFRDKELCQHCQVNRVPHKVPWDTAEIHHVAPYETGSKACIKNAALVHKDCLPKTEHEVDQFREWFFNSKN